MDSDSRIVHVFGLPEGPMPPDGQLCDRPADPAKRVVFHVGARRFESANIGRGEYVGWWRCDCCGVVSYPLMRA